MLLIFKGILNPKAAGYPPAKARGSAPDKNSDQSEILELPNNEYFGEMVANKLFYCPTVTREEFRNKGRLTDAMRSKKINHDLGFPDFDLETDRFMICGSTPMLKETCAILNDMGFREARGGDMGHYVIERAFVEQ